MGPGMEHQQANGPNAPPPPPPQPVPPTQPPQPLPAPQVAANGTAARALATAEVPDEIWEYVLSMDPGTQQLRTPDSAHTSSASTSSNPTVNFALTDSNTDIKPQNQDIRRRRINEQDDAAVKRMRVNDDGQQTTKSQGMMSVRPAEQSAAGFDDVAYKDAEEILAKMAGVVLGPRVDQQQPQAPQQPMPPPPPTQQSQPLPRPVAGPQVPANRTTARKLVDAEVPQEIWDFVLAADARIKKLGPPATAGPSSPSTSSNPTVNVPLAGNNAEMKLQNQDMPRRHINERDDAETKRMEGKDERQQPAQSPPAEGPASENKDDYPKYVALTVTFSSDGAFDGTGPIGTITIPDFADCQSGDEAIFVVEPNDHGETEGNRYDGETEGNRYDGETEGNLYDGETEGNLDEGETEGNLDEGETEGNLDEGETEGNLDEGETEGNLYDGESEGNLCPGTEVYIDLNGNVYRRLENVQVLAVEMEDGELKQLPQNTGGSGNASPDTTTAEAQEITALVHQRVERFPIVRGEHFHMEGTAGHRHCIAPRAQPQNIPNVSSSVSHPGCSVRQGGAPQPAAPVPKGTGRLSHQQMGTSRTNVAAPPAIPGTSSGSPSQVPGGSASVPPPLANAGGKNMKGHTIKQAGFQPKGKWGNTGGSTGATTSPYSVDRAPPAAGNTTGTIFPRMGVQGPAKQREQSILLKAVPAQRDYGAKNFLMQHTLKLCSGAVADPGASVSESRAPERVATLRNRGKQLLRCHLPQPPSNAATTVTPFRQASQARRAATVTPSPTGSAGGNRNVQPGIASNNIQHRTPDLQAGRQDRKKQMIRILGPNASASDQKNPFVSIPSIITSVPSAPTRAVGNAMNQQPAERSYFLEIPVSNILSAAAPPGRQEAPTYSGTPGNSRNQEREAVHARPGSLLTRNGSRCTLGRPLALQRLPCTGYQHHATGRFTAGASGLRGGRAALPPQASTSQASAQGEPQGASPEDQRDGSPPGARRQLRKRPRPPKRF